MILGISNDPPAKNLRFKAKQRFPFDLLCDESLEVALAYGAAEDASAGKAKRISYLIGADGTIEKVYAKVKAAEHADEVLADLRR